MQISDIEVFLLYDRFVYVKVDTNEGISGWGAAIFHGGEITAKVIEMLGKKVAGKDPFQTDAIWWDLFSSGYRLGSTGVHVAAISALDIAFHDIKGKALGTPVWNLLGGKFRERVPVYSSLMQRYLPPEENVDKVRERMKQGYSWVKLHTATAWRRELRPPDDTIDTVQAIRNSCGGIDDLKILIDVNQAYTVSEALKVGRALEYLDVSHFEEPIFPWDLKGYNTLQASLDIPIAAGEQHFNLWQFQDLITKANLDILQPNITACGGFTQGMKIASLAESYNIPLTCHNTEPMLTTATHLHLWATCRSCVYPQEYYGEDQHPLRDITPVLKKPIKVEKGYLEVPNNPGLGVEVDEDMVRKIASGDI
jgi:L-alanine-DL-glutamate epimerase-like enolase superfamily enzyme